MMKLFYMKIYIQILIFYIIKYMYRTFKSLYGYNNNKGR